MNTTENQTTNDLVVNDAFFDNDDIELLESSKIVDESAITRVEKAGLTKHVFALAMETIFIKLLANARNHGMILSSHFGNVLVGFDKLSRFFNIPEKLVPIAFDYLEELGFIKLTEDGIRVFDKTKETH